jgi:hypothetical protein
VLQHDPHAARKNPHSDGLLMRIGTRFFEVRMGLRCHARFANFRSKWVPVAGGVWYRYRSEVLAGERRRRRAGI